jgi:2-phosphoglycerate kinase
MYAVVFQVDMKPSWEGNVDAELDALIETVKAVPGFVRGTWATNGKTGTSFIVVEDEQAAKEMAGDRSIPPEASVTFRAVDIYEIVRDV